MPTHPDSPSGDPRPHVGDEGTTGATPLTGWKDIAAYLGRSIRTAQRYERDLDLPVHRLRTQVGDTVYAFGPEIDRWRTENEAHVGGDPTEVEEATGGESSAPSADARSQPPPDIAGSTAPPRGRRPWLLPALGAAVLVALTAMVASQVARAGRPASATIEHGILRVFDSAGRALWSEPVDEPAVVVPPHGPVFGTSRLLVADLDDDGTNEVLRVVPPRGPGTSAQVQCLDASRDARFAYEPTDRVRTDGERFGPAWQIDGIIVAPRAAGRPALWMVMRSSSERRGALRGLDAQGRVVGTFWTAGWITAVAGVRFPEGRRLVVGGTSAEQRSAFVAVVDADRPDGSLPGASPDFACLDCPAGAPLAVRLFPRHDLARLMDAAASVGAIRHLPDGTFDIAVRQGTFRLWNDDGVDAEVHYSTDKDLAVLESRPGPGFAKAWAWAADRYRLIDPGGTSGIAADRARSDSPALARKAPPGEGPGR